MRNILLNEQHLKFVPDDVFDTESFIQCPEGAGHSQEKYDRVSGAATKTEVNLLRSILKTEDKNLPEINPQNMMNNGPAFELYVEELQTVIEEAKITTDLEPYAVALAEALRKLQQVTAFLLKTSENNGRETFLADASLYLELFGIITIAWQWLLQAISIQRILKNNKRPSQTELNFYMGKMSAIRFFFGYELPKTDGLIKKLMNTGGWTIEASADPVFK